MSRHSRRTFIRRAAVAGIATNFTIAGTKASGKVLGANDSVRLAVAGVGGRGNQHLKEFAKIKGVEITTLIDPDKRQTGPSAITVADKTGVKPKCLQDIRQALDDKNIDAVSICSPNHWHSLMTIWCCQAGKDVYVEKPCSHNVFEGRKAVEAVEKYNRVVQHGTQRRSRQSFSNTSAAIHSEKYGKLLVAKAYCCKTRWSIGYKPVETPPKEVDFDVWLGPAAKQPYHANLLHYNWHWFWDFGNGDMGNMGVHLMDVARWGIKDATLPRSVWSLGGRWVETDDYKDQGQTPNMELSVFDFDGTLLVFETRGLTNKTMKGGTKKFNRRIDNEFYTTEGVIRGSKFYPNGGGKPEKITVKGPKVKPGGPFGSFIQAVRSHKPEDVNTTILDGHYASALCHLGNISYRLGKDEPFNTTPKQLGNNRRVAQSYEMIKRNLEGIGVKLDKTKLRVGPVLEFDAKTERFVGNDAANKLLTRDYRAPFVVPKEV